MASNLSRLIGLLSVIAAAWAPSSFAVAGAPEFEIAPPKAYIEFCFREPQECPSVNTTSSTQPARAAGAEYWRLVFKAGEPGAVSRMQGAEAAPLQANLSDEIAVFSRVNQAVNRQIVERSDASVYRRSDYWALPLAHGAALGDCEDFVLEKRRILREMGVTERQMSIAIVRTPWDENHAVLLVSTEDGEMVLDNLSPRMEPWARSSYRLLARQSASNPSVWLGVR